MRPRSIDRRRFLSHLLRTGLETLASLRIRTIASHARLEGGYAGFIELARLGTPHGRDDCGLNMQATPRAFTSQGSKTAKRPSGEPSTPSACSDHDEHFREAMKTDEAALETRADKLAMSPGPRLQWNRLSSYIPGLGKTSSWIVPQLLKPTPHRAEAVRSLKAQGALRCVLAHVVRHSHG